jgi:zinc transporter ZupT
MGKKRRILQQVIFTLMALTGGASCLIAWFVMRHDRSWLAFYVACGGGVMLVKSGFSPDFRAPECEITTHNNIKQSCILSTREDENKE